MTISMVRVRYPVEQLSLLGVCVCGREGAATAAVFVVVWCEGTV